MNSAISLLLAVALAALAGFVYMSAMMAWPFVLAIGAAAIVFALLSIYRYTLGRSSKQRLLASQSRHSSKDGAAEQARVKAEAARKLLEEKLAKGWSDTEEHLANLSLLVQKRSSNVRLLWFKKRVEKFIQSNKKTFDFLSQKLEDQDLNIIRLEYLDICKSISKTEQDIADIKAAISMNNEPPGGANHRILAKSETKLDQLRESRLRKINKTQEKLAIYGVNLSLEQTEVLLSRIDADDIMQMTAIFTIISKMTEQFASAKLQTSENLEVTKKYYGMYIALLELQMHIQNKYLNRLENKYIPGVNGIRSSASDLLSETKKKLKSSDERHISLYEKNLKAQEFTINVTTIYRDALEADKTKISHARGLVRASHDAAVNTLKTVQISADLSSLVNQNESLYQEVMALQVPELVPFENLQMQREFEAVTARLQAS